MGTYRLCSRLPLGAVAASVLILLVPAAHTSADSPLTVCTSGCQYTTIAAAIAAAQPGDHVKVGPGTYAGGLVIDKNLTLAGSGSGETTLTGGGSVVLVASGVTATIRGVTIEGGTGNSNPIDPFIGYGGGILNEGALTLQNSMVRDNTAGGLFIGGGAGIFNNGTLTVNESTITGNSVGGYLLQGGGILNLGVAVLDESIVGNNSASVGGGIGNDGVLWLTDRSAVTGNHAARGAGGIHNRGSLITYQSLIAQDSVDDGSGGGVANDGGSAALVDSEVLINTATFEGGGIFNGPGSHLYLLGSLVAGNRLIFGGTLGGGIFNFTMPPYTPGAVTMQGSAVVANSPNNCVGTAC